MDKSIWVLLLLPIIASVIGWFTNYIAIKMLFHPREPKKFLGLTIHGVFPKRQAQVAQRIGNLVATELLSAEEIKATLSRTNPSEGIERHVGKRLDIYFEVTLPLKYPFISRILSKKMKGKIKAEILNEISRTAPGMIAKQVEELSETLDIEKMIEAKVSVVSAEKLEAMIWSILDKEFKFIEVVGAVLGFLIGLVQVGLMLLVR